MPGTLNQRERPSRRERNDEADHSFKVSVSPYFDYTRHNVRREWLRWKDLGANGQVLGGSAKAWRFHGPTVVHLLLLIKACRAEGCPLTKQPS